MIPDAVGPLSRLVDVRHIPPGGLESTVTATEAERAALARDFGLPALDALTGEFQLSGKPGRIRVTGRVTAKVTQTCVVTLEPFDSVLQEDVQVDFDGSERGAQRAEEEGREAPDPIVGGRIDLGALAAEFLALGLDPYPRKPGAALPEGLEGSGETSPFAALQAFAGGAGKDTGRNPDKDPDRKD